MKKKLTKKQIIIISVTAAILVAAVTLSVTLPIVLSKEQIPQPHFEEFDQKIDMYVTVAWEKARNADGYTLQYVYGNIVTEEDKIVTVRTDGLFYRIERQKGVLACRVKRNSATGRDGAYSEWIYLNVAPLKLEKVSNVTLNAAGILSWQKAKYNDRGVLKDVPTYVVDLKFEGEYFDPTIYSGAKTTENNLRDYVRIYLAGLMSDYDEATDPWQDITLTVKIKSLNYYEKGAIKTSSGYEFLYNAYEESEYYEQVIKIDKTLYKSMKG